MSEPDFLSDGSTPRRTDPRWSILQKILGATRDGGGGGGGGSVPATRTLTAGNGLTGGGDLSADRAFAVQAADGSIVVTAGGVAVGSVPWADITGTPTTLAGYGITQFANSYYVFVGGEATAAANGLALTGAYIYAQAQTPGGLAKAASNRFTIVVMPGVYDVGDGNLVMSDEFIDIIGLSKNTGAGFFASPLIDHGETVITSTGHTLTQSANNVTIANVCLRTSSTTKFAWNLTTAVTTASKMLNVLITNTNAVATPSMPAALTLAGYYEDVRAWNQSSFGNSNTAVCSGVFIRCKAGAFSFATALSSGSIASGRFEDCEADGASFGTNGTASGTFIRCRYVAIDTTVSPMFGGAGVASGYFQDCVANGQDGSFGNTASGRFVACRSDITVAAGISPGGAFGCGTTGLASGNFYQCSGGNNSFGGSNNATGRTFTGRAYQCVAGMNSFGGGSTTAGVMGGIMLTCRLNGRLNAVVAGKIDDTQIVVSNVDETAVLVTIGASISRCTLVGNGTGFSVDAPAPVSVLIYQCSMNLGFGANVTNLVATPYNVNDVNLVS